jgi:Phosphoesterase family
MIRSPRSIRALLFLPLALLLFAPKPALADGDVAGRRFENDKHPPTDIQRGEAYVSQVLNTIRNGPYWKDSVIFFSYDEHGGYYDHVASPRVAQGHQRTPDGISPGQCADLSNAPASLQSGAGVECAQNPLSKADTTIKDAEELCPDLGAILPARTRKAAPDSTSSACACPSWPSQPFPSRTTSRTPPPATPHS